MPLVDLVHCVLELHAAKLVVFGKQRGGVVVVVLQMGERDGDFGWVVGIAGMVVPEVV